ncbi:MAG: PAS domain S-box protein [Desulfuromonas sp.]|nr:PAS domain S-box protein [Desulfuromonas sp.]
MIAKPFSTTKYPYPDKSHAGSLLWFLLGRAFIASLFLGGTVYFSYSSSVSPPYHLDLRLVLLLALTFLQICFSLLWILKGVRRQGAFIQVQIVWDLALCTLTVYVTGGVASQFAFLYIFVIFASGLFCKTTEVFMTFAAAMILYGGLVDLQYYGFISPESHLSSQQIFYRLFLNSAAFLLTGLLSAVLSSRLQKSQCLLERERSEFVELEHLNSLILKSIPSGLAVIDLQGGVRSFNEAAASISGVDSRGALSSTVADIFPQLDLRSANLLVERGEFHYVHPVGEQRIIGYSTSSIHDSSGSYCGILIAFQDLTKIKKMEQDLQLKDKLSAIGGLSAGLAHEIRNPLASLSGSVELMKENATFSAADEQLMEIVSREAGRLNRLLSDFLIFARPREPQCVHCNLSIVIDDVVALARSDADFAGITISWDYSEDLWADVDQEMFQQLIWNLVKNGSRFVGKPGQIGIYVSVEQHSFWVDDNGHGVDDAMRKKIFEPFYTTRADGTGLGLSIAHSIVTAHDGTIECLDNSWGGARFLVSLPVVNRDAGDKIG